MGKSLLIEYKYFTKTDNQEYETTQDNQQISQPTLNLINDIAIITCPPQNKSFASEVMLRKLVKDWANSSFDTQLLLNTHINIFLKIAKCFPRKDIDGWGFDVHNLSQEQIESLFFKKIVFKNNGKNVSKDLSTNKETDTDIELQDCDLLDLIKPDPIQPKPDDGLPKPPPPTSGDDELDLLAALTNCLESYEQAILVCNTLSLSDIYKFIKQLNELKRDPEEVIEEWMADEFAAYKTRKGSDNYAKNVLGL